MHHSVILNCRIASRYERLLCSVYEVPLRWKDHITLKGTAVALTLFLLLIGREQGCLRRLCRNSSLLPNRHLQSCTIPTLGNQPYLSYLLCQLELPCTLRYPYVSLFVEFLTKSYLQLSVSSVINYEVTPINTDSLCYSSCLGCR